MPSSYPLDYQRIDQKTQPVIFDSSGVLRGKICKAGEKASRLNMNDFSRTFFFKCKSLNWMYSDFCFNNVVIVNDRLSLIDFDTHLSEYSRIDVEFEQQKGALRPHVFKTFSSLVYANLNIDPPASIGQIEI